MQWHTLAHKVIIPAFIAPVLAFGAAFVVLVAIFWIFQKMPSSPANRMFRVGQLFSGTFVAYTHGANDAQKTMGVIALALVANGSIDHFYIPTWVKISAGLAIARAPTSAAGGSCAPSASACTRWSRRPASLPSSPPAP